MLDTATRIGYRGQYKPNNLGVAMSEFRLNIRTSNDAFQSGQAATEVANLLREVADKIEHWDSLPNQAESIFDYNGGRVGQFKLHTDD